jgi:hypothetical protein
MGKVFDHNGGNGAGPISDYDAAIEELRERGDSVPADDLGIPGFLDRRGDRTCAQCGAGRPDDQPTICVKDGERLVWLHERGCHKVWLREHE